MKIIEKKKVKLSIKSINKIAAIEASAFLAFNMMLVNSFKEEVPFTMEQDIEQEESLKLTRTRKINFKDKNSYFSKSSKGLVRNRT